MLRDCGVITVNIVCIGRGIWFPKYAENDSIEKMSDLRADVGTQMMLFERCLFSARTALQLVTELQQLIGHVERVTEMLEMLDTVTKTTAREESKSIVQVSHPHPILTSSSPHPHLILT